jgi:hypothetical protein
MSSVGPPPLTRLVLQGMSLFMAPSGGGCCWLSVRRLAEITGLDKGTISKHRAQAVTIGWLIAGTNPRHRQSPTFWCAIPDGIPICQSRATRRAPTARPGSAIVDKEQAGPRELLSSRVPRHPHLLSGGTVQSQSKLYVLKAETVRSGRTNRTSSPDQSSININDLDKTASDPVTHSTSASGDKRAADEAARTRLDAWIRSDGFLQICQTSPDLALRLTPPNCRAGGYEPLVREAIEKAKK